MNEDENSITAWLSRVLSLDLSLFVAKANDELGTGTEAPKPVPNIVHDSRGWAYPRHDVREQYESECG